MYNLFVSGDCEAWDGSPTEYDLSRCLSTDYTDSELAKKHKALTPADIAYLSSLPCLFAYEDHCDQPARVGTIKQVKTKGGEARIEYIIKDDAPALSPKQIHELAWDLGIGNWEMNRTHWALKTDDLNLALRAAGFDRVEVNAPTELVDITRHVFDIALSFPGEHRPYVDSVAKELAKTMPSSKIFYDNNYKSQLARPNLDNLLQDVYRKRSKLVVVFLCNSYAEKQWCGVEFRAIKEIIMAKEDGKIMFIRHDDGTVPGTFSTDGYIDATAHTPGEVAALIAERAKLTV
jgi:hypothetical protein